MTRDLHARVCCYQHVCIVSFFGTVSSLLFQLLFPARLPTVYPRKICTLQVAKRLVEDLYRDKGVDPSRLSTPFGNATAAAPAANVARAAASAVSTTSGGGRARLVEPIPGGAAAMIGRLASGKHTAAAAVRGKAGGGGGGGGGLAVEAWGGELRALLKRAQCEKHLDGFRAAQMDIESLSLMRVADFKKMGVSEVCCSV